MRLSFSHIIYTNTWKIHVYPATILFGLTNIYLTILNLYPLPHQMKISNKNKKFLSNLLFSGKRKRTKEKFLRITENNKTKITIQQKQDFSRFLFYQNKILFFFFRSCDGRNLQFSWRIFSFFKFLHINCKRPTVIFIFFDCSHWVYRITSALRYCRGWTNITIFAFSCLAFSWVVAASVSLVCILPLYYTIPSFLHSFISLYRRPDGLATIESMSAMWMS